MKLYIKTILTLALLASTGCATTKNKNLDSKMTQEAGITSRKDLSLEATQTIDNSTDLSNDQKSRLSLLRTSLSGQLNEITSQSLKLRSVLIKELLSPGYNPDEVDLIKKRMRKLEDDRLSVMFDGVEKANAILGRQASAHFDKMRELLEERGDRMMRD